MALPVPAWKLPFLLSKVLLNTLTAALLGIASRPQGWTYRQNISYTLLNALSKNDLLDLTIRSRNKTTLDIYRAYMLSQKLSPEIIKLDAGTGAGWIGSPKAKEALLYFHGSGYVNIASEFLFHMLGDLVTTAKKDGKDFSVLAVEYGLAPKAVYPQQLIQAVTALQYLLSAGYSPENIFVGGDSAGAHIAISLLSHLSHPHPDPSVPRISLHSNKLAGCFLISPWVTFSGTSNSMKENANKDFVIHESLKRYSDMFMNGTKEDEYNTPLSASVEWWKGFREVVGEVGVLVGEYEIFMDDVVSWVDKVKVHNPEIEFFLAPAEIHDQAVVDRGLGLKMPKSEVFFRQWVMKRLRSAEKEI